MEKTGKERSIEANSQTTFKLIVWFKVCKVYINTDIQISKHLIYWEFLISTWFNSYYTWIALLNILTVHKIKHIVSFPATAFIYFLHILLRIVYKLNLTRRVFRGKQMAFGCLLSFLFYDVSLQNYVNSIFSSTLLLKNPLHVTYFRNHNRNITVSFSANLSILLPKSKCLYRTDIKYSALLSGLGWWHDNNREM